MQRRRVHRRGEGGDRPDPGHRGGRDRSARCTSATSSRSPADGTDAGPEPGHRGARPPQLPKIAISGQASLLGVTAAAHVTLSDQGFDFGCAGKVFGAFDAAVTAKGASLQSADGFTVHAQMSQNFLSDLTSRAAAVLQQAGAAGRRADRLRAAGRQQRPGRGRPAEHPGRRGPRRPGRPSRPTHSGRSPTRRPRSPRRRTRCPRSTRQIASTRAGIQAERDAAAQEDPGRAGQGDRGAGTGRTT